MNKQRLQRAWERYFWCVLAFFALDGLSTLAWLLALTYTPGLYDEGASLQAFLHLIGVALVLTVIAYYAPAPKGKR